MLKTAICDLFGIEHSIIQGRMVHLGMVAEALLDSLKNVHQEAYCG